MAKDGFIVGDRLVVKIQRKKPQKEENIEDGNIFSNKTSNKRQVDKRK